jgi:chaperonin cofactor prefoldin
MSRLRAGRVAGSSVAVLAVLAIAAPGALAKQATLSGQLIGDAAKRGSKVEAPVLLSEKSAKQLKLRSPLATLSFKASRSVPVPNPQGAGHVSVAPDTLRSGDRISGKGKLKGSAKKLMPIVKAGSLTVTDRESAYSVDELTAAVADLYQQVGALGLRVDALEDSLADVIAELERLKAQDASLAGQINTLITRLTNLETALEDLTGLVGGLPTAAQLQAVIDDIADLQAELAGLGIGDVAGLQGALDTLTGQMTDLTALCALGSVTRTLLLPTGFCD